MGTSRRDDRTSRWRAALTALAVAAFVMPSQTAVAHEAQGTITFTGGGWGHSVGMSQYGAEGMARQGYGYTDILTHYYTGVQVASVTGIADLKVGIAQNASQAVVSALDGASEVRFTNGTPITAVPNGSFVTVAVESPTTCSLTVTNLAPWTGLPCDLDVVRVDTAAKVVVGNRTVNRGFVFIRRVGNGFHVGAQMDLEEYLRGIAEIPNSWRQATQRAQAVAARSYAIATALGRRANPTSWWNLCACDLRAGPVDQNWEAFASESVRPNFVQAVVDTTGQAIVRPSAPTTALHAYYSSSTFGRTEPNEIGFGGSAVDYLRSVDDQWGVAPAVSNPFATWTRTMSLGVVAPRLGFDSIESATTLATSPATGAITAIRFTGRINGSITTRDFLTRDLRLSNLLGSTSLGCGSSVTCFPSLQVTSVSVRFIGEQAVLHDPTTGIWHLRSDAGAVSTFYYGNPGDTAFMGDWDCNGTKTPGLYRRSDGYVYLRNSNSQGVADIKYFFGNPSDLPIAGDFDGDGCDTVSIYRPSEARFYIINRLGSGDQGLGPADYSFLFGNPGDVPVVGDWNGNNTDTVGLRRPSNGFVYIRNTNSQGVADTSYFFGNAGDLVFAGDWDDDGVDTMGLFRPSTATVFLKNTHATGSADVTYGMGTSKLKPAGAWAG